MTKKASKNRARTMTSGVLGALAATAVVTMAPLPGSAAPQSAPSLAVPARVGTGTWGWSYCYQYSYDDGITRNSNYNQNSWTASYANVGNIQNSGSGAGGTGTSQWSYSWVFGNGGVSDCRPSADVFNVRAVYSAGIVTITGLSEQPATKVTISTPNGVVFCVATTGRTPLAQGGYGFSCQAPWLLGPGTFILPVLSERFGALPVDGTATLVIEAAPAVTVANVTPNPTPGPVTVSGTTTRPGANIVVKNPDGSVLCTTTSGTFAVNGTYAWSCAGTIPLPDGPQTLTVVMTAPSGETATTSVPVTRNTPLPALAISASATPNPSNGPVTVSGLTTRPNATVTVTNPDGSVLCTTTSSGVAVLGTYGFSCAGTLPAPDGAKTLTVTATTPDGSNASTTTTVTRNTPLAALAISASATPNPSNGPVTVSGATTRPNATVTVTNPDGSVLCTTTSSGVAVLGSYAFSCAGTLPAPDGAKTLTVTATTPDGGNASTTTTVTRTTARAPLAILNPTASPNPTTGPVTISGTTNYPGAKIVVKNADGTTLCTTTSSIYSVGGSYAFSCAGTVTGTKGTKTLTINATYGSGNSATATVNVSLSPTKTGGGRGGYSHS